MRYRFVRYWFKFAGRPWLNTDIPSKHFVCLQDVFKTSSRHVFKTSSRHVFKTSSRRLQRNNFSSSKTSSRRLARGLENVFKTSSRRLGRRKIVTLKTCWRRLQDMSWRRLEDQQMFAGQGMKLGMFKLWKNFNLIGFFLTLWPWPRVAIFVKISAGAKHRFLLL